MERCESETSVQKILTPSNHPKEIIQHNHRYKMNEKFKLFLESNTSYSQIEFALVVT